MAVWRVGVMPFRLGAGGHFNVSHAIQKNMFHRDVLINLFACAPGSINVFRLMSSLGRLPTSLVKVLADVGQMDLAFHLSVCNEKWEFVVDTYFHPCIEAVSRDEAFSKIILRHQWSAVIKLADDLLLTQEQLCLAFKSMLANARFLCAIHLYQLSFMYGLQYGDTYCIPGAQVMAVVEQFRQMTESGIRSSVQWEILDLSHGELEKGLGQCPRTNTVQCLLSLVNTACIGSDPHEMVKAMFVALLMKPQGFDLLLKATESICGYYLRGYVIQLLATEAIVETKQWALLMCYRNFIRDNWDIKNICMCLKEMKTDKQARKICGPILDSWFNFDAFPLQNVDNFIIDFRKHLSQACSSGSVARLVAMTDRLLKENCDNLSFGLCLVLNYWSTARKISRRKKLNRFLCFYGFIASIIAGETRLTVALSKRMKISVDIVDRLLVLSSLLRGRRITFASICSVVSEWKHPHLADWGLFIATMTGNSVFFNFLADKCSDTYALAYSFVVLTETYNLKALKAFAVMNRHPNVLPYVLSSLILHAEDDDVDTMRGLLHHLDPCLVPFNDHACHSLLGALLDEKARVRHALPLLIQAGVSTREHCRHPCHLGPASPRRDLAESAMAIAIEREQLGFIKLLYESGATTNHEIFVITNDFFSMHILQLQGRDDIVDYLKEKASTVRSLQDISRQSVSHLIGCRPGREDRVHALELGRVYNRLLMFEDCIENVQHLL